MNICIKELHIQQWWIALTSFDPFIRMSSFHQHLCGSSKWSGSWRGGNEVSVTETLLGLENVAFGDGLHFLEQCSGDSVSIFSTLDILVTFTNSNRICEVVEVPVKIEGSWLRLASITFLIMTKNHQKLIKIRVDILGRHWPLQKGETPPRMASFHIKIGHHT